MKKTIKYDDGQELEVTFEKYSRAIAEILYLRYFKAAGGDKEKTIKAIIDGILADCEEILEEIYQYEIQDYFSKEAFLQKYYNDDYGKRHF